MGVSVIGTVGVPACYGGFESLVENLIDSKNKTYYVYCQSSAYRVKEKYYKKAELKYLPLNANGIQSIPYDIASIFHSLLMNKNDLLILGVSGAIAIPIVKLVSSRKVVTNIDGLEWKRNKWGKFAKRFLKFCEGVSVRYSDIIVSDNQAITDYVKAEYNKDSVTIAYGGDHAIVNELPKGKGDYYLSLCRIEPENNVEIILHAFSQTTDKLKFVGNWDNSEFGRLLKLKYSSFKNIEMIDPIYDLNSLFELRARCKGYVHGHSAGGTNPSLVEMMHFNTNIICFDCSYNRESTESEAYYFHNINQLHDLLGSQLESNGIIMLEIAKRRYTWNIVRNQYEDLF